MCRQASMLQIKTMKHRPRLRQLHAAITRVDMSSVLPKLQLTIALRVSRT